MVVQAENNRIADVICQHKRDGTIIPLKIRLRDEDGEYQVYSVRGYKDLSHPGEYTLPNGIPSTNHTWKFECKIVVFGTEKRVRLFYNAYDNRWTVEHVYSN